MSRLPNGYIELEYIESTGGQYIDTGYAWTSDKASVETEVYRTEDVTSGHGIYGNQKGTQHGLTLYKFGSSSTSNYGAQFGENGTTISTNLSLQTWYTLAQITDGNTIRFSVNQVEQSQSIKKTLDKINSVYLFTSHYNAGTDGYAKIRCKYFKLTDNGILVRNLIPAKRTSDSAIGMYDTVSQSFFTNSGTGNFIAGPIVMKIEKFDSVIAIQSKNLLNVNDRVLGELDSTTGNVSTSAVYYTSNYIDISNLTDFTISLTTNITGGAGRNLAYYDSNKTFISGVRNAIVTQTPTTPVRTFTKPSNAIYIRFTWLHDYLGTPINDYDIMIEEGSTATSYEPYRNELVRFNSVIAVQGKNLFDKNKSWQIGSTYANYQYQTSDTQCYIKLFDNDTSVDLSGVYFGIKHELTSSSSGVWFVTGGSVVSTGATNIVNNEYSNYLITFPNNQATVDKVLQRFKIMVVEGSTAPTSYEPYGNKLVRFNDIIVK